MSRKLLSLENLGHLDMGVVQAAFQNELSRIVADIKDRPEDDHSRKVSINFVVKPADKRGDVVSVECEVVGAVPKRISRPYEMRVQGESLVFEGMSPEDADQLGLDAELERKRG